MAPFPRSCCSLQRTVQSSRRHFPVRARREGKGCPCLVWVSTCWSAYSEAHSLSLIHQRVSPSPESAAADYQVIRTLWGVQCLWGWCSTPPRPGHLPEKPQWFVRQPAAGVRKAGWDSPGDGWDTRGRCNDPSTQVSLQPQAYREHTQRQPNSHMYELQRWSSPICVIKSAIFLSTKIMVLCLHLSEESGAPSGQCN